MACRSRVVVDAKRHNDGNDDHFRSDSNFPFDRHFNLVGIFSPRKLAACTSFDNSDSMALKIDNLSNNDIARLCNGTHNTDVRHCGRSFKMVTHDVIVKYGWSVTADEAANQKHAYLHSRGTKIYVPKVYRYFRQSNIGYLVMEFIDGIPLENSLLQEHPDIIQNLAEAIHAFATKVPPDFPGPRDRGIPRGYLFSEDGAGKALSTINSLNSWLDERARLTASETGFNFQLSDCVFCHMDLSRRNIILQDEFFYLLDWEYAGFYPREFEKYCILFIGQKEDHDYAYLLSNALDSVYREADTKIEDEHIIGLLDRVYRNNLKYSFTDPVEIDWEHVKMFGFLNQA